MPNPAQLERLEFLKDICYVIIDAVETIEDLGFETYTGVLEEALGELDAAMTLMAITKDIDVQNVKKHYMEILLNNDLKLQPTLATQKVEVKKDE